MGVLSSKLMVVVTSCKILFMRRLTHRKVNDIITILVVAFSVYVIAVPYLPQLSWKLRKHSTVSPYEGVLRDTGAATAASEPVKEAPQGNRIVIPVAGVDLPIIEGNDVSIVDGGGSLRKKLWVESPKDIGNTVIIAHRFSYRNPAGGFYHLDEVHVGDRLAIYWQGEELVYQVVETKIVPSTAVEIENNTPDRTLTLYTCTPIFSSENRLVVIAKPYIKGDKK